MQLIDTLEPGGAERMCVNIANVLHKNGYSVILCATRNLGRLQKDLDKNIKSRSLQKKGFFDVGALFRFLKIVRSEKIDLIHAHSTSVFWAVLLKIFCPGVRIIWHDHFGNRPNDKRNNGFYRVISPLLSGVITVSQDLYEWSIKNMMIPSSRIFFIRNFPDIKYIGEKAETDYVIIVCLANLRPEKDHITLVKAIHLLTTEYENLKLKVIFAGRHYEDGYFYEILKLIEELDLKDTIQIPGMIEEVSDLLASADIGVLSSVFEGLPISLLEYGLAGLPVVVTDVGQCSEVLSNGALGRVAKAGDAQGIAKELAWIINNRKLSMEMGIKFRDHVNKEYGSQNFISQYECLLNKILEND